MRINEIITETQVDEIDRRGFLKGLGATGAGLLGAQAVQNHNDTGDWSKAQRNVVTRGPIYYDSDSFKTASSIAASKVSIYISSQYPANLNGYESEIVYGTISIKNYNKFPVENLKIRFNGLDKNGKIIDTTTRKFPPTLKQNEEIVLKQFNIGHFKAGVVRIESKIIDLDVLKESVNQSVAEDK
jgi:hypothetical protein